MLNTAKALSIKLRYIFAVSGNNSRKRKLVYLSFDKLFIRNSKKITRFCFALNNAFYKNI